MPRLLPESQKLQNHHHSEGKAAVARAALAVLLAHTPMPRIILALTATAMASLAPLAGAAVLNASPCAVDVLNLADCRALASSTLASTRGAIAATKA